MLPSRSVKALWNQRRRFAPAVLLIGMAVVGSQLLDVWPHETEVRLHLGDHGGADRVRITYWAEGEAITEVELRYDHGAPEVVTHTVELYPGRYRVEVELRSADALRRAERVLEVPAEGVVVFDLGEEVARR